MLLDNFFQEWDQKAQHVIVHIIVPRFDPDAVQWSRIIEILCQVINYYCLCQVAAKKAEVFDRVIFVWSGMLPV